MRSIPLSLLSVLGLMGCLGVVEDRGPEPLLFSQLDYGYPVHMALDDPQVAYIDVGEGPETLVLVHGMASNMGFWRYNVPALAEHYRVIALDLPGYGRSGRRADHAYTLTSYARAIDDLVAELGLDPITLVGQSMGGQIAMVTALQHPASIARLVLVNPAGIETFEPNEAAWLRSVYTVEAMRDTPEEAIRRNIALNFHEWDERLEWMVEERLRVAMTDDFDPFAHAVARSVGAMLDEPTASRLDAITQPTLLVYGANDALIPNPYLHPGSPDDLFGEAADRIPDATLVAIPEAGHLVMIERPAAFNRAVLGWLRQQR